MTGLPMGCFYRPTPYGYCRRCHWQRSGGVYGIATEKYPYSNDRFRPSADTRAGDNCVLTRRLFGAKLRVIVALKSLLAADLGDRAVITACTFAAQSVLT